MITVKIKKSEYIEILKTCKNKLELHYKEECLKISRDIKSKWYLNFYDFLNTLHLTQDGVFERLYPYSDKIKALSMDNKYRLLGIVSTIDILNNQLNTISLDIVGEEIEIDSVTLGFIYTTRDIVTEG